MTDLWSFLLQTLTASGAALLLLGAKALFRDKLSPRWQFSVWGLLGLALFLPAGRGGRYVLLNWPWLVEVLRTLTTGEYGAVARVTAPLPLPPAALPKDGAGWLFLLYFIGAAALMGWYLVSYLRLRLALRQGVPAGEAVDARIRAVAQTYDLPTCPAVIVPGLSTAFVCGLFRPVLALPQTGEVDDKVLLHELLHLKYHDVGWGLLIALTRCVHWCNPLLWYCADRAGNDLEALCDQRVLERLEGEDRRDYGRILLSMADERYARVPGTSSMANGGRNIRRRVEAIARFKRYPANMALVSGCMALVLALPIGLGTRAGAVYQGGSWPDKLDRVIAMASARVTPCTTPAGAMDAYGKAVLSGNGIYRAMCAPLEQQGELVKEETPQEQQFWPFSARDSWDPGLPDELDGNAGYEVYDLMQSEDGAYIGLFTVPLSTHGQKPYELETACHGVQSIRVENQNGRWVVIPQEGFRRVEHRAWDLESALPAWTYEAQSGEFLLRVRHQNSFGYNEFLNQQNDFSLFGGNTLAYNMVPQPDAEWMLSFYSELTAVYVGDMEGKAAYTGIGGSCVPWDMEGERPALNNPSYPSPPNYGPIETAQLYREEFGSGSSSDGMLWGQQSLQGDWDSIITLSNMGSSSGQALEPPKAYAADFYLNWELADRLTLLPTEGGLPHD